MKYLFNIIMLLIFSFAGPSVFAQSELRKVLDEIGTNNPSLNSGQYYMEAKQFFWKKMLHITRVHRLLFLPPKLITPRNKYADPFFCC